MRSFVSGKARDAKDIKSFLQQNRPAIEALDPALACQIEAAATTKGKSAGFKASPAGRFVEGDLGAAVRSTLGAPDSAKRLQALRMSVGSNPEAVKDLQKAIIDDFRASALSKSAQEASENARFNTDSAARWLESNRGAAANVLTPDQVSGLDAIVKAFKDQAQSIPGRTGSPTFDRLATESILGALLSPRFTDAPLLHPVKRALGLVYSGADNAVSDRLFEVLQDLQLTAALMKKATDEDCGAAVTPPRAQRRAGSYFSREGVTVTPQPTFQRAYNQVPSQPEKNAAATYTMAGADDLFSKIRNVTAMPSRAETVWTSSPIGGSYHG
ncbi:hypothetical protein [Reyranella sp.]|uniref:hypothetical protein n=1 Tax=Reyranella sp. TaxID=1929291 RepID=UPI0012179160|nr:hypothetical protein [Reyranella sp.]TAJ91007.1 MAG: hypothetical protein EPO50_00310 [Reyranella sp.]